MELFMELPGPERRGPRSLRAEERRGFCAVDGKNCARAWGTGNGTGRQPVPALPPANGRDRLDPRLGVPWRLAALRLNMLPVVFPDEIQKDVVYSLPYSDKLWDETKERARGGKTFHSYHHSDRIYFWPHSGEEMPADLDLSKASTHL